MEILEIFVVMKWSGEECVFIKGKSVFCNFLQKNNPILPLGGICKKKLQIPPLNGSSSCWRPAGGLCKKIADKPLQRFFKPLELLAGLACIFLRGADRGPP